MLFSLCYERGLALGVGGYVTEGFCGCCIVVNACIGVLFEAFRAYEKC